MSLAHSRAPRHRDPEPRPLEKEGWTSFYSNKSEQRPRFVAKPDSSADEDSFCTKKSPGDKKKPYIHPHGNAKPSEPPFLQRRPSLQRKEKETDEDFAARQKVTPQTKLNEAARKAGHIHPRPWTTCCAPGRKENPHQETIYHRTWLTDCGVPGRPLAPAHAEFATENLVDKTLTKNMDAPRPYDAKAFTRSMSEPRRWTRARKKKFYEESEADLLKLKCHDEMFAHGTNAKMWTHLMNNGVTAGGDAEKLDATPKRKTGLHLKSGIYKGKYDNVRHSQVILCRRRKHGGKEGEDHQVDPRTPFDNRLRDDMIKANDATDRLLAFGSYDISRPCHTRSCPQMGAEWMHR